MCSLRVLLITYTFPPEIGTGRLAAEFAINFVERGHSVDVLTSIPRSIYLPKDVKFSSQNKFFYKELRSGVRVIRVKVPLISGNIRNNALIRGIEYFILPVALLIVGIIHGSYDVVMAESPPLFIGFIGSLVAKIKGAVFIVKIGDIHPDALVNIGLLKNRVLIYFLTMIEKLVYLFADHIVVIAGSYKQHIENKINPIKICYIPNWADVSRINTKLKIKNFNEINLGFKPFLLIYAGTMSWPQDLETIVDAAALLEECEEIRFLFVGEGVKKNSIIKRTEELNLHNVLFLDQQPSEIYFQLLFSSDACFIPLRSDYYSPTLPSKTFEIMACSKPIIANVPFNSEVCKLINRAKCGIWVEPGNPQKLVDAVITLYHDKDLVLFLGENGKRYLEDNFSLNICMDRYETLFYALINEKEYS